MARNQTAALGGLGGGVGVGFRPELAGALLASRARVDFVEVVAETCRAAPALREVSALAELWPVLLHGVGSSPGSAEGIDHERARELGRLARALRAPFVSEHVAFVRAGGVEIGHLCELPMTREAVGVVARNVAALRRHLPDVPLLLENVARSFVLDAGAHEMSEGDFYYEIVEASGCGLLLDVANLYANAKNSGVAPDVLLAAYPLEHVALLHLAGGATCQGFYHDTHAHPVPDEVFDLARLVFARCPAVPAMIERDAAFDHPASIVDELTRLRDARTLAFPSAPGSPFAEVPPGAPHATTPSPPVAAARANRTRAPAANAPARLVPRAPGSRAASLVFLQAALAQTLVSVDAAASPEIDRARSVLQRKRAATCLSLLPNLAGRLDPDGALTLGDFARVAPARSHRALADARRLAEAARRDPRLATHAETDLAFLAARFVGASGRARVAPFVSRARLSDGRKLWVIKGFGSHAAIRSFVRGPPFDAAARALAPQPLQPGRT